MRWRSLPLNLSLKLLCCFALSRLAAAANPPPASSLLRSPNAVAEFAVGLLLAIVRKIPKVGWEIVGQMVTPSQIPRVTRARRDTQ